jgi:predicted nucleic acid-binding protein
VVDASVAISFLQGDAIWHAHWAKWADASAQLLAPPHFTAEVANALLRSVGLPASEVVLQLERLDRSGVETVDRPLTAALEAVSLADHHGLTVYDALYLQLALDLPADLATLGAALRRAATDEDVPLVL